MAIVAAAFFGCGKSAPKANLKSDVDSLSYAIGMASTYNLNKGMLAQQLDLDTAYMDEMAKGMLDAFTSKENKKERAYYIGVLLGMQYGQQYEGYSRMVFGEDSTKNLSANNYIVGIMANLLGKSDVFKDAEDAGMNADRLLNQVKKSLYADVLKEGEAFQAKYGSQEGVGKIDCSVKVGNDDVKGTVLYKILKVGNGPVPTDTSKVNVHYEGKLINDTVFDSSIKRGEPVKMNVNQVVPGFKEALTHMPVGSKWEVVIPQQLAYGGNPQPGSPIKPFSTLIFTIELLGIEK